MHGMSAFDELTGDLSLPRPRSEVSEMDSGGEGRGQYMGCQRERDKREVKASSNIQAEGKCAWHYY